MFCLISLFCHAQKKTVNNTSYKEWERLSSYNISNDGKWVYYETSNPSSGSEYTLLNFNGEVVKRIQGIRSPQFSEDSAYLIYTCHNDSVGIFRMKDRSSTYLHGINNYKLINRNNKPFLFYNKAGELFVYDLYHFKHKSYGKADKYFVDPKNNYVITYSKAGLRLARFNEKKDQIIYDDECSNIVLSADGSKIAFFAGKNTDRRIFVYNTVNNTLYKVVSNFSQGIKEKFELANISLSFNEANDGIFFNVIYRDSVGKDANLICASVDVWSYKDLFIQPNQKFLLDEARNRTYTCFTFLARPEKVIQLEDVELTVELRMNRYVVVRNRTNEHEEFYNKVQKRHYVIINLLTGEREEVPDIPSRSGDIINLSNPKSDKFLVIHNLTTGAVFSFQLSSKTIISITDKDHTFTNGVKWFSLEDDVILTDGYDLWKVDLHGKVKNKNITNGFGAKNRIKLRPISGFGSMLDARNALLIALNDDSKTNGFWKLNDGLDPIKLCMDSCLYYWTIVPHDGETFPLIQARDRKIYLVTKQTASHSPNLFISNNLRSFRQLSHVQPENKFNWLKSELLTWTLDDGSRWKGILYKPENFDSSKKYPVIFHFYQSKSDELNFYMRPALSGGSLSIPWYVSNGYLVFVPDIKPDFSKGKITEHLMNVFPSAVRYLGSENWVDKTKIGLQGHSFGGYETNLLIANCSLFAAAQSSAGISNVVSDYGDIRFGDESLNYYYEKGQGNLGTTPWDNPDVFVKSSVIFKANKITTPLLLQHNQSDGNLFRQGVEMFSALRRLKKPVWMLQYDYHEHVIDFQHSNQAALDFTVRQQQFFDHYLKDKPAPLWMVEGIPAKYKGIKSGLQLDSLNRIP